MEDVSPSIDADRIVHFEPAIIISFSLLASHAAKAERLLVRDPSAKYSRKERE